MLQKVSFECSRSSSQFGYCYTVVCISCSLIETDRCFQTTSHWLHLNRRSIHVNHIDIAHTRCAWLSNSSWSNSWNLGHRHRTNSCRCSLRNLLPNCVPGSLVCWIYFWHSAHSRNVDHGSKSVRVRHSSDIISCCNLFHISVSELLNISHLCDLRLCHLFHRHCWWNVMLFF